MKLPHRHITRVAKHGCTADVEWHAMSVPHQLHGELCGDLRAVQSLPSARTHVGLRRLGAFVHAVHRTPQQRYKLTW